MVSIKYTIFEHQGRGKWAVATTSRKRYALKLARLLATDDPDARFTIVVTETETTYRSYEVDVPAGDEPAPPSASFGTLASDMPDDCHDECVPLGFHAVYFPYEWTEGLARYRCKRGHYWTCGWGHSQSGSEPANAGQIQLDSEVSL